MVTRGSVRKEGPDNGRGPVLREAVLLVIGCVVTLVWAIATIAQVIFPERQVSGEVHLIMLAVAGSFFGSAALSSRKTNGKNGKDGGRDDD
jgi:hypothetical protein